MQTPTINQFYENSLRSVKDFATKRRLRRDLKLKKVGEIARFDN